MAGGGSTGDRSLKETPTWAVATVCAVFVLLSIAIEHGIHSLGKLFQKRQKKAMSEALEKIKAELMLLGFLSLLLTFGTRFIAKICIPEHLGNTMLPCKIKGKYDGGKNKGDGDDNSNSRRKLFSIAEDVIHHRVLAAAAGYGEDYCKSKGKVSLISQAGVNQLHIFIFVLAIFHVLYSVMTIVLAKAKMRKWEGWESETSSLEYQFTNDPARFRFAHQTSFVKRHSGLSRMPGIRWVVAFFRQFFGSISKVDYLTMRNGFINAHFAPNSKFDFHKYIKRSMEDDFKVVVGISAPLWGFAILFLLLNVYQWYTLSWMTLVPLIILLSVGTKLELIIMEMAREIQDQSTVVAGAPVIEPNNKYFWFNRPRWILFLIQYTLFQNAFQMAYFLWTWYEFGIKSCFHENLGLMLGRVFLGLALQIVCSYITFPLYALVTQMGTHMKQAIFEEQTAKALMKWRKAAKEKRKLRNGGGMDSSVSGIMSGETTPSRGSSPMHLLHSYKPKSNQPADIESVINSPISYPSDTELSETEGSYHHGRSLGQGRLEGYEESHNRDFSFRKPPV